MIRGTKRPRVKAVEIIEPKAQKIDAKLNASIHNRFDIEVVDAATGELKQRAQAENIICNALWTRLFAPDTYFNYIHYGTGAGTPAATDTSLFTFLGYGTPATGDDVYAYDWDNGWVSLRRKIQLSESTAVGSTLTEVGIGYSTTSATLCTHAMLKDMNGNQISIAKTSTDIINIYATVFAHFAASGFDGESIMLYPTPSTYRASDRHGGILYYLCGQYSSANAMPTAVYFDSGDYPAGGKGAVFPCGYRLPITWTYALSTKEIVSSTVRIPAADGNGTKGIVRAALGYALNTDYIFSPLMAIVGDESVWYSGSNITGESIGTGNGSTKDFATTFGYISSPKIYVDGAEVASGITIDTLVPVDRLNGYYGQLKQIDASGNPFLVRPMNLRDYISLYFENPNYATIGITSMTIQYAYVFMSNDLINWTYVVQTDTRSGFIETSIPSTYKNYRYIKITPYGSSYNSGGIVAVKSDISTITNIHFTTPPAAGAVITADYTTKSIAKDANHVFDLTVTIQLGEHTE